MNPVSQAQEESSSLRNQTSIQDGVSVVEENTVHQAALKALLHLRENRIFYFIVAASVLVLVVMMQIRTAYRTYDDNERLVKLWADEKELKDIMSHTAPPDTQDAPQIDPSTHNNNAPNNSTPAAHSPTKVNYPPRKSVLPTVNKNARPVAGVSRAQVQAVKRWMKMREEQLGSTTELSQEERKYYEQRYNVSQYAELPFCIVIPSYNNAQADRHLKNIKTVAMQDYTNYHIVFIDDASTDGTGQQVAEFMQKQTRVPPERFQLITNKEQMRAMPNLRRAAREFCRPYQIFLIIDGDDELIGRQVLKLFNAVFQRDGSWFVYSNFLSIRGNVGYSRPFPQKTIAANSYRKYPFVTSHLRAFYTQLFLNIREEDLKNEEGEYLKAANDVAICIPVLEQAHTRVTYIRELTYFYNSNTGQNNHQLRLKEQRSNDRMIRRKKPYQRIDTFLKEDHDPNSPSGS